MADLFFTTVIRADFSDLKYGPSILMRCRHMQIECATLSEKPDKPNEMIHLTDIWLSRYGFVPLYKKKLSGRDINTRWGPPVDILFTRAHELRSYTTTQVIGVYYSGLNMAIDIL